MNRHSVDLNALRDLPLSVLSLASVQAKRFTQIASYGIEGGHAEIFAIATDGSLCHRWYIVESQDWSAWMVMNVVEDATPTSIAAAAHGDYVDLFVVTEGGHLLKRWLGPSSGWSDWEDWGDGFDGPVSTTSRDHRLQEVWAVRYGRLIHQWLWEGSWSGWHEWQD